MIISWVLDKAIGWILDTVVRDSLNWVWSLLTATLFHLPDVTDVPQVQALSARALLLVNTAYVLVIIVTGLLVMTHGSLQIRYGAGELLPRLVFGLGAANFATPICVAIIETANTAVQALTGQGIASTDSYKQLLRMIDQQLSNPAAAVLTAVIGLILVVLAVLLLTGWITRWILLIVLCGIAPVALACHGIPWTEGAAQLWWRSMGGIGLTVVVQAVALNTGLTIMLDPDANYATYGLPVEPDGLLNLIIIAVLLWATVRIPSLVHRHLSASGNRQNIFGALVRLVIAQQITRRLGSALRATTRAPHGAHRGTGGRHVTGRATGNPLRGFTPRPPRSSPPPGPPTPPGAPTGPTSPGGNSSGTASGWQGAAGPGMTPGSWPAHRTGIGWPGSPAGVGAVRRQHGQTGWPGSPTPTGPTIGGLGSDTPTAGAPGRHRASGPATTASGQRPRRTGTGWPASPAPGKPRSTSPTTPSTPGAHQTPPRKTGPPRTPPRRTPPPNRSTP